MRFVPKHVGVRVLAVLLAFLLWVHVVTNKEYEYTVQVPFTVAGIQAGLLLVSDPPPRCELRVKGSGKQLLRFLAEIEDVSIDAAAYSTGSYAVDLTPDDLVADFKSSAEITEVVFPKKLRLRLEERLERFVKVVPDIQITPALGYLKEGELSVTPESVVVSGPKLQVRDMTTISTEHLSYTDITSSLQEQVRLSILDSAYLTLSDSTVTIEQAVIELKERTFTGIPVGTRNADFHTVFSVIPDSISVTVEAPPAMLDSISADQFEVWIDLAATLPGSTFIAPRVTFPKGLRLVDVMPSEIRIEVPRE